MKSTLWHGRRVCVHARRDAQAAQRALDNAGGVRELLRHIDRRVAHAQQRPKVVVLEDKDALGESENLRGDSCADCRSACPTPSSIAPCTRTLRARACPWCVADRSRGCVRRGTYRSTRHAPTCAPTASIRLFAISASSALDSAGGTRASGSSRCSCATISLARFVLYAALCASVAAISTWSSVAHTRSTACCARGAPTCA